LKMTEQEWMECKEPERMLNFVKGRRLSANEPTWTASLKQVVWGIPIIDSHIALMERLLVMEANTCRLIVSQLPDRIRCVFGPLPFRSISFNPAWLTPIVTALAEQIYNDRAFDRLPILADALEEAGCTVKEVVEHCRNGGEHVRGCWVVDKVLGKE
jgi:hypothetical protein